MGPGAAWEERQPGSDHVQSTAVVVSHVVDQAAAHRHVRTTQFLGGDLLTEGRLHHRGAGGEHRSITGHHRVVRQGHHQGTVPGRRPEDGRHQRDPTGQSDLLDQVGRGPTWFGTTGSRWPVSRPLQQHDQR